MSDQPAAPVSTATRSTRKAGRDLKAAIIVGVSLGALALGSLLVIKELFLPVLVIAIGIGAWEMRRALKHADITVPLVPVLLGAGSMILGSYYKGAETLVLTFGLTCVALIIWRTADGLTGAARDIGGGILVSLYPCFLAGFAALLLAAPDGQRRIIFFILVTIFSDIGGYAVGVLLGKHPMAPSISPKKSWEGFAGSVLSCAVVGTLALVWMLDGPWWGGALIGAVLAGTATVGDFIESSIKRDLGIKDMGTLLPGHGGIMDRLDSLVVCVPVAWAMLSWLVPLA